MSQLPLGVGQTSASLADAPLCRLGILEEMLLRIGLAMGSRRGNHARGRAGQPRARSLGARSRVRFCRLNKVSALGMYLTPLERIFVVAVFLCVLSVLVGREGAGSSSMLVEGLTSAVDIGKELEKLRITFLPRSEWKDPELSDQESKVFDSPAPKISPPAALTHVIFHHSGHGRATSTTDQAEWTRLVRAFWKDHTFVRDGGWGDIGYHFLIAPDGTVYEGRKAFDSLEKPLQVRQGAHAGSKDPKKDANKGTLGIAYIADLEQGDKLTDQAILSAVKLVAWVLRKAGLTDPYQKAPVAGTGRDFHRVLGHGDVNDAKRWETGKRLCIGDITEQVADMLSSVRRGLRWLRSSQKGDGSWSGSTGITALALLALLNAGADATDTAVSKGLAYLLDPQRYDAATGRFSGDVRGDYPCYTYDTALGILALVASEDRGRPRSEYRSMVAKARDYLLSIQYSNPDNPNDPQTGGWGYPAPGWTDLSNTQWVVMAVDAAYDYLGEVKPAPTDANSWTGKLLRYLGQCQRPDGGFGYRPGEPSWGSMSAAGLWSLVLAGVDTSDARVAAVLRWIGANYQLDANPGRRLKALYYYHTTLAKALTMADFWEITTPDGRKHDWYAELAAYLEGRQSEEGYWVNSDPGEWEGNRDLCTAYAILALQAQELPSGKQLSWVLTMHSPAELHLYDWLGRHVGRNEKTGAIDEEIPGSSYSVGSQGEQVIRLSQPEAGRYRIEIIGTGTGVFVLESKGYLGERRVSSERIQGTIARGQVKAATATLTSLVGPLTVYISEFRSVPYGLTAVPGKGCVDLSWRSYQEDGFALIGYRIYRSTTSRVGYTRLVTVPGTQTTYRDTQVVVGTTYYYVITAVDSDDEETPFSREVNATPLGTFAGAITVGPNPVGTDGGAFFYVLPDGTRMAAVLIFDIAGRQVAGISLDPAASRYPTTGRWNPVDRNGIPLANGPYVYVLIADGRVIGQGKMVIQR